MKSILLIIPYFGKWPVWFAAHIRSCETNPSINWLLYTDCEIIEDAPKNIRFVKATMDDMKALIEEKIDVKTDFEKAYKLCDIKPAYGQIFEEYTAGYDFWGFTDIDIIWGDIRKYITDTMLETHDVITTRKHLVAGHFAIFKNTDANNQLYKNGEIYKTAYAQKEMKRFCEGTFSDILADAIPKGETKVYWDKFLVNHKNGKAHQEYYLDKWLWKDGEMLELKDGKPFNEVMYLHFINWKKTMKYCEVEINDNTDQFLISYNGVHTKPHNTWDKMLNTTKNLFNGYYVILKRKKLLKKLGLN